MCRAPFIIDLMVDATREFLARGTEVKAAEACKSALLSTFVHTLLCFESFWDTACAAALIADNDCEDDDVV